MEKEANLLEARYSAPEVKEVIIAKLIEDGYGTYAKRFRDFTFVIADAYHGHPIQVAAMFPETGDIVINPGLLNLNSIRGDESKALEQLCLLIRHELLHFLLVHQKRLKKHIENTDKDFEKVYYDATIQELANYAMDYDISNLGYDTHDKEVVKFMTLNGKVIGGLLAEEDHPEWATVSLDGLTKKVEKSMEEMFDILRKDYETKKAEWSDPSKKHIVKVEEASHSQAYRDMYNKIIKTYGDDKYSIGDLSKLITDILSGKTII